METKVNCMEVLLTAQKSLPKIFLVILISLDSERDSFVYFSISLWLSTQLDTEIL